MRGDCYPRDGRRPTGGRCRPCSRTARSPVSQDIIHNYAPGKIYSRSERSTAATRGGPGGARAVIWGCAFPRREMDAAAGLGDAGPVPQSKSLSSEIYAQSRGRWRDEARKQRLRGRRGRVRPSFPPGGPRGTTAAPSIFVAARLIRRPMRRHGNRIKQKLRPRRDRGRQERCYWGRRSACCFIS